MLKAHDAQLPPLGAVGHIEDGETRVEAPCIVLYYRGRYHIGVRFLDDGSIHEYRDGVFIPLACWRDTRPSALTLDMIARIRATNLRAAGWPAHTRLYRRNGKGWYHLTWEGEWLYRQFRRPIKKRMRPYLEAMAVWVEQAVDEVLR
jgi:hypothetical protein